MTWPAGNWRRRDFFFLSNETGYECVPGRNEETQPPDGAVKGTMSFFKCLLLETGTASGIS